MCKCEELPRDCVTDVIVDTGDVALRHGVDNEDGYYMVAETSDHANGLIFVPAFCPFCGRKLRERASY